jgi:fructosamine-3-kinase
MKDFRSVHAILGLIATIVIAIIIYFYDSINTHLEYNEDFYLVILIIALPSMPLLCWIIDDRIEKTSVKIKISNIETNTPNQVMDSIKRALEMRKPSQMEILANLYTLQANNSLSNFEFFDKIGETYQLNPMFFMLSIYPKIRRKFSKIYGDEGTRVMHKYILEKFCLDKGEQIIYELNGKIRQKVPKKYTINVLHGTIYLTNYRIVAHGKFAFIPYQSTGGVIFDLCIGGSSKAPKEAKIAYISRSTPCYGYSFPIKNLYGLINPSAFNNHNLSYSVKQDENLYNDDCRITIDASKKEDYGDKLFAILDKFQRIN